MIFDFVQPQTGQKTSRSVRMTAKHMASVGRGTYPVGTSVLGLPLIQLRLGLGIHFDQEFLVAQKQLVEKSEGSQCGLGLLILTEAKGF